MYVSNNRSYMGCGINEIYGITNSAEVDELIDKSKTGAVSLCVTAGHQSRFESILEEAGFTRLIRFKNRFGSHNSQCTLWMKSTEQNKVELLPKRKVRKKKAIGDDN